MSANEERRTATSLAKGPAALIGLVLLAYGVTGLIFGSSDFTEQAFDGTVGGERWLGLEANGWTNLLILGSGALLILSAPLHVAVKSTAMLSALALGAAALIALGDGDDALGIFAVDEPMKIALGAAAASLLAVAMLPRVGRDRVVADEPQPLPDEADRRLPRTAAGPGHAAPRHRAPADEAQVVRQPDAAARQVRSQDVAPAPAPQAPAPQVRSQDVAPAPAPQVRSQDVAPDVPRADAGTTTGQVAAQPVSTDPTGPRASSTLDRARRRFGRRRR